MKARKFPAHSIFIIFTLMLMAALMDGCTTAVQTLPAASTGAGPAKPTQPMQETRSRVPTKTRVPTNIPKPVETLKPVSTTTAMPAGLSRSNPYPGTGVVSVPNWDIQVLEVKRGEQAWQDMQAASDFNEEAPEGKEYLIVKLHVKSSYADSDEHSLGSCDFSVTGDQLINYMCGAVSEMEPALDATLTTGGEAEGWATYLVSKGEKNMILVFQELFSLDEKAARFIALDKGASIRMPAGLANVQPTELGAAQDKPALRTEKVTSGNWELSVSEVVRGEDAWSMVQAENSYNDPPADGMEYIAVKVQVHDISNVDQAESLDSSSFQTIGSAGNFYDSPAVDGPVPPLDISLYPGGEYEGWVVLQAATGETGVLLVFQPAPGGNDADQRFIMLEP